jgi:uncharacterized membrane protein
MTPTPIRSRLDETDVGGMGASVPFGSRAMVFIRRAFNVCAILWAAALPAASLAAGQPRTAFLGLGYPFALTMYSIGSVICHQRPERSFRLFSVQMPVCARCAGLYWGAAAVVIVMALFRQTRRSAEASALHLARDYRTARFVLLLAALPTAITLVVEWASGETPANWIRAAAGAPLGAAAAWVVARAGRGGKVN